MKLTNRVVLGCLTMMSSGLSPAWADNPSYKEKSRSALDESDVQMLAEMHKSNLAESGHGKLARESATTPGVRAYGKALQNDHAAADKKLMALIAKRKVDRRDFDARVNALASKGKEMEGVEKLHSAKGANFDQMFVSHMAEQHERTLEKVSAALEQTRDGDVKLLLQRVKPVLERHHKEALNLMNAKSASSGPEDGRDTRGSANNITRNGTDNSAVVGDNSAGTGSGGNSLDAIGPGNGSRGTGTGNKGTSGATGSADRGPGKGSTGGGTDNRGTGTGNQGTGTSGAGKAGSPESAPGQKGLN